MNPEHTIRTASAGRRAAAIRDGRAEAGDATTIVAGPQPVAGTWRFVQDIDSSMRLERVNEPVAGYENTTTIARVRFAADQYQREWWKPTANVIAAAPELLAALRALVAVAPANAHEDPDTLEALSLANQAIVDADGRRRCDCCNGTGFMRLLQSHTTVPCTRCVQQ